MSDDDNDRRKMAHLQALFPARFGKKSKRLEINAAIATASVIEWLTREETAAVRLEIARLREMVGGETACRVAVQRAIGTHGAAAGPKLELYVAILEAGLCTVAWKRVKAELAAFEAGSSASSGDQSSPSSSG